MRNECQFVLVRRKNLQQWDGGIILTVIIIHWYYVPSNCIQGKLYIMSVDWGIFHFSSQNLLSCGQFHFWGMKLISLELTQESALSELRCGGSTVRNREEVWRTRQHSTQSVRNMPPPSPRHLLPHVLQIMPRNAKYDQFQPKGHHNEENPQSMTKMPGNPKFYLFH